MCNYTYRANYKQKVATMGKTCPYPKLYKNGTFSSSEGNILPIDNKGCCIFHSENITWKRENNFKEHFFKLIKLIDNDDTQKHYDFSEIKFVGDEFRRKRQSEIYILNLSGIEFRKNKDAEFCGSTFVDSLELEEVDFDNGVSFDQVIFNDEVKINKATFNGFDLANTRFKKRALFSECIFRSYALFNGALFSEDNYVQFQDSIFEGYTDFSRAIFIEKNVDSWVTFQNVIFEDTLLFNGTQFHKQLIFKNTVFKSNVDFIDTFFATVKSAARYAGAAVEFNDITITKNCIVNFQSTDPQKKIFNHDVQMSFKEELKGNITFENVNFNKFIPKSKKLLLKMSKIGRVTIGTGCLKYRYRTEIRTISVEESNVQFILEICQTFTDYFIANNGLILGFEIVERNENKVDYYYFTDENISQDDFFGRLKETDRKLWNLLYTRDGKQYLSRTNPAETIRNVDATMSLMSIFFRIGIRRALGLWKPSDTEALVNAIEFSDKNVKGLADDINRVIVDKYTGETFLAMHLEQNMNFQGITINNVNNITQIGIGNKASAGHNSAIKE